MFFTYKDKNLEFPAIHQAVLRGQRESVLDLLNRRMADPNQKGKYQLTALDCTLATNRKRLNAPLCDAKQLSAIQALLIANLGVYSHEIPSLENRAEAVRQLKRL